MKLELFLTFSFYTDEKLLVGSVLKHLVFEHPRGVGAALRPLPLSDWISWDNSRPPKGASLPILKSIANSPPPPLSPPLRGGDKGRV
jgi:hypothetical protein